MPLVYFVCPNVLFRYRTYNCYCLDVYNNKENYALKVIAVHAATQSSHCHVQMLHAGATVLSADDPKHRKQVKPLQA